MVGFPACRWAGTTDPSRWEAAQPLATPARWYLTSVAPGATIAVAENLDQVGETSVLRSSDRGHAWTEDPSFRTEFPDEWAWTATRVDGVDLVTGTTTATGRQPGPPRIWISRAGGSWTSVPVASGTANLPTTTIPQLPPATALTLVTSIGARAVLMSTDPALDRYYVVGPG